MPGRAIAVLAAAAALLSVAAAPASAATLAAPKLQAPVSDVTVEQLPALTWDKVKSAATYEVELAADQRFGSLVTGRSVTTGNTAYVPTEAVPDGDYFWRIRGLTTKGTAGKWSQVRRLRKTWAQRPNLLTATGEVKLLQPSQPLILHWSPVNGAVKYLVEVATDPSLATQLLDDHFRETASTSTVVPVPLAPGKYHWAVTPVDARGHHGARSAVGAFVSDWPAQTVGTVTDLNADDRVYDPELSWQEVAGAVGYDVEVNYSSDFAVGSKVCCSKPSIGTTVSPTTLLANNTYYWRVRAIDAGGNPGGWNAGPEFRKVFDDVVPTVPGLRVRDNLSDTPTDLDANTALLDVEQPVIRWDPVPGASSYELQVTVHTIGCDWNQRIIDDFTVSTSWVLRHRTASNVVQPGPEAWPTAQEDSASFQDGVRYCVRVNAIAGEDEKDGDVVSQFTQIGGTNQAAFQYRAPVAATVGTPVMAADDYVTPVSGTVTPRNPLFTWKRIGTAESYWVIVSRDQSFTNVKEVGFTRTAAYSPRSTFEDETTTYYWAVVPATQLGGGGVFSEYFDNNPRPFEKRSVAPVQVAPDNGADVLTHPRFAWAAAEGAVEYRIQVATDPSFGSPTADVTTAATSYTPTDTYPVDTVLYWRVRANALKLPNTAVGLTWSEVRSFRRRLPTPVTLPGNPLGGEEIPVLGWAPVQGAAYFELHAVEADGDTDDGRVSSAAFSPIKFYGTGVWHWQVRAVFPGSPESKGPFTALVPFTRSISAPSNAKAQRSSGRMLVTWSPVAGAKSYRAEFSDTTGFIRPIQSESTDHTAFAPDLSRLGYQKGGTIYWRVAAADEGNNTGAFASGTITLEKRLVVTAAGKPKRRLKTLITIRVSDAGNADIKGAKVVLSGAGVKVIRKTPKSGSLSFQIKARKKGTIVVKATRKGYKSATTKLRVR